MSETLLDVKNLKKYFKTNAGMLHAVDDVSFSIEKGHTMGVVGESGCGKSTLGRTLLQLYEPTSGEIDFKGKNIANLSKKEFHQVSSKTSDDLPGSIFQSEWTYDGPAADRGTADRKLKLCQE